MWTCGCQWCLFYGLVCCGTTSYVHGGVTQVCCAALRNRNTGSVPALALQYIFTLLRNSLTGEKKANPNLCYVRIIIIIISSSSSSSSSSNNLTALCGPFFLQ